MAVVVPLDSRQASITRLLLTETGPATVEAIASELKLTSRVVRYNLPSIETFLRPEGLHVMRRRGVGVWVSGEEELGASRPTVRRDVRVAETWLAGHHLHLQRLPGVGIAVRGSEIDIRKGLLALVLEAVPAEW